MSAAAGAPVLSFDVGGTHLRSALVGDDGAVNSRRSRATPQGSLPALVTALAEEGRAQLELARAAGGAAPVAGLAIAGFTDTESGLIHLAPNLGLREAPVGPALRAALGMPVRLVNDVNAAAVAEAHAVGARDLVAILCGTGVGGGFVSGGELLEGRHGMAAEVGHVIWREGSELRCGAGHRGCVEAFLGGACLAERAAAAGLPADTEALWTAARAGVPAARAITDEAQAALAALVRLLVTLLDPDLVVIAGGLGTAVPELMEAARTGCEPHPLGAPPGSVRVVRAATGSDAGLLGAAALARAAARRA
jgi:glucokinase